jgi:NADPH-dependent 2,4-dienoyl-CoA reductase/sulfur reductase-like enzyme
MKKDIVVIGGNPAGGTAAMASKKMNKEKSVLVIRKEPESLVPCGIPYTFGTLTSVDEDIKPLTGAKKAGVEFLIDEVISIDTTKKTLFLKNSESVSYEKLILALGSEPVVPPISGSDLEGVFTVRKEFDYIKKMNEPLKQAKNVVVVGAGFIGVEMSDEIVKNGTNVTLIEAMDTILPLAFDADFSETARKSLQNHGVKLRVGEMVKQINGINGTVSEVKLKSGETIPADMVLFAIGYRANTELAQNAGLHIGVYNGIITDDYLRTSAPDVFAVGDCAEHRDYFTHKVSRVMLASISASEARIAGMNLYDLNVIRQTKGCIAVFSTSLGDVSLGAAGLTEKAAITEGFSVVTGNYSNFDHHPKKLPGTTAQTVKLVFAKKGGLLLGAQISGGLSTGEMINILGLAIQKAMTMEELSIFQYGTQPLLTAGPGLYPIPQAAIDAIAKSGINSLLL